MAGKRQNPHVLATQHARPPLQRLQRAGATAVEVTVDAAQQAVIVFAQPCFLAIIDGCLSSDKKLEFQLIVNVGDELGIEGMQTLEEQEAVVLELERVAAIDAFALDVVIGGHRHLITRQQTGHIATQLLHVQPIERLIINVTVHVQRALVQIEEIVVERHYTRLDAVVTQHVVKEA